MMFEMLANDPDINKVRKSIADLIVEYLEEKKNSLGYWEKYDFAFAIIALKTNLGSKIIPTDIWLRLCLICLENAFIPKDKRNEEYTRKDNEIDALTYQQLLSESQELRARIIRGE